MKPFLAPVLFVWATLFAPSWMVHANGAPSTPDRHFKQTEIAQEVNMESLAYVRCPTRKKEVFRRNETGGFERWEDDASSSSLRGASSESHADKDAELYHPCWCTEYYHRDVEYCPSFLGVCVVHGRDGPVECQSHSGSASMAQMVWPTGFFFVCLVFLVYALTKRGVYLVQYIRRVWWRPAGMDQEALLAQMADNIWANSNGRPALLNEDFIRRERRRLNMEQHQQQQQQSKRKKVKQAYGLKIKRFVESVNAGNEEDHDYECAICLGAIEHGESIGDIPCGHIFHKECLKTWVKRRKRCPLCQDESLLFAHPTIDDMKTTEAQPSSGTSMIVSSTDSDTTSDQDGNDASRPLDLEEPSTDTL